MPSTFELLCAAIIALGFGLVAMLQGYKLFLVLLPLWGFVFGFMLGAQTIDYLASPDPGTLATVTSWVVGFVVGAVFAVLSYLFWLAAVAIWSFGIGYGFTIGLFGLLQLLQNSFIVWILAVAVGVALAFAVIRFNVQKWIIMLGSALLGAGVIIGTFLVIFGIVPPLLLNGQAVALAMKDSIFWLISFVALFVVGAAYQWRTTRDYMLVPPPDRWQ